MTIPVMAPVSAQAVSPAREAEIAYTMALRLFKSRHEVYGDWHWRRRRVAEVRGHIGVFRAYQKKTGDSRFVL